MPWVVAPPFPPDGTIGDGDRQHIAYSYSGILAGAPTSPGTGTSVYVTLHGGTSLGIDLRGGTSRTQALRGGTSLTFELR